VKHSVHRDAPAARVGIIPGDIVRQPSPAEGVGVGLCSLEELGSFSALPQPSAAAARSNGAHASSGSSNGQPRLRDQLCLLIRQYNLDPILVKAYAAGFCGTQTLSGASRDLVESFVLTCLRPPGKTEMPWSANSTPTPNLRRPRHEASNSWSSFEAAAS
jgi:hypothetical protein